MKIYGWKDWGARAKPSVLTPQRVTSSGCVFLHHSVSSISRFATKAQECRHMRELEAGHLAKGYVAIGYSYIVFPSGRVYKGRGFTNVPAAQRGSNTGHGAICFVGDFRKSKTTWPARRSAVYLARLFPGKFLGWHGQVYPTECPGPNVRKVAGRIAELAGKKLHA